MIFLLHHDIFRSSNAGNSRQLSFGRARLTAREHTPVKEKKIPKSILGRTGRLLLSGARIASKEVTGRIAASFSEGGDAVRLATKIKQTQDFVRTLGQLKGAAMKAGQFMSLEFGDLLPEEVSDVLRQLHDSSTFMPEAQMRSLLLHELGTERLAQLKGLTAEPIAAASIGQVHRASLAGRDVVVKIQFPGVADSIDSDLAVLRRTMSAYLQLQGKTMDLVPLFEELARCLKQEADYLQEADNVAEFRQAFAGSSYIVPEVFRELSTKKVLTLSYERGVKLVDWLRAEPGPKALQHFSALILDLLIQEFFVHGIVQTDPNYGNFLYRPQDGHLVLLDFGATNRYTAKFRQEFRLLLIAACDGDQAQVLKLTQDYGFFDRREPPEAVREYLELMRIVAGLFSRDKQPINFADEAFIKSARETVFRLVQEIKHSPPAKHLVFLNRKLGGMFHVLKDAGTTADLHAWFGKVRELNLTGQEDR